MTCVWKKIAENHATFVPEVKKNWAYFAASPKNCLEMDAKTITTNVQSGMRKVNARIIHGG